MSPSINDHQIGHNESSEFTYPFSTFHNPTLTVCAVAFRCLPVSRNTQILLAELAWRHSSPVVLNFDRIKGHRVGKADTHSLRVCVPRVVDQFLNGMLGRSVGFAEEGSQPGINFKIRVRHNDLDRHRAHTCGRGQELVLRSMVSNLSFERLVEHRGKKGVEFGSGIRLEAFQGINFAPEFVQMSNDAGLLAQGWEHKSELSKCADV